MTPPSVTSSRRLMRPDEYHAALAADMSESDIHHLIVRSMAYALYDKSPGFRVAVPLSAVEQAKAMLKEAGWDTQVVHMGDVVAQIVVERPTPVVPLDVFLLGDVVVVAEDAKAARRAVILTAEATPVTPMGSAFASGLLAAGDARQVDSSEVLSVYMWDEDGGTSVTHTAAEWVSSGWRGVIGPLDGSDLEARIRAALVHRPECDGVPCYCCGEGGHGLPGTVVHADIEETLGILKDIVTQSSDGAERWAKLRRGGSTGDRTGLPDAARLVAQIGLERCGLELSWAAAMRTVDSMRHQRDAIHANLAHLTYMIGDTAKDLGVLCEGRTAMDFFPEVLAKTKADARLHSASLVNEAYRQRNAMVCVAAQLASDAGLHAGIIVDEAGEPGFRTVVAIDLGRPPDGANQITFHMDERDPTKPWSGLPPYGGKWDGHSDTVKWARIASYLDRATGISEVGAVQLHLYSIGPYAYVAADANEVYALHAKMVAGSEAQIDEQVAQATNEGRGEEIAEHVEVLKSLLHIPAPLRTVADDAGVEAVLTESGAMTLTAAEWIRRGKGFVGVRATHYAVALRPHLDALGGGPWQ